MTIVFIPQDYLLLAPAAILPNYIKTIMTWRKACIIEHT